MKVSSRPGGNIVYMDMDMDMDMDLKEDGNLLLESLQAQFEGAIGLRYTSENGFCCEDSKPHAFATKSRVAGDRLFCRY